MARKERFEGKLDGKARGGGVNVHIQQLNCKWGLKKQNGRRTV